MIEVRPFGRWLSIFFFTMQARRLAARIRGGGSGAHGLAVDLAAGVLDEDVAGLLRALDEMALFDGFGVEGVHVTLRPGFVIRPPFSGAWDGVRRSRRLGLPVGREVDIDLLAASREEISTS